MSDVIEINEKKWEFRTLYAKDIFPIANIIGKIGIGEFVKLFEKEEVMDAVKNGGSTDAVGLMFLAQAAQTILGNLDRCENDIYKILSSCSNLSVKEVQNLSMGEFVEMIVDFIKKDDFADFFKQVFSLLG